MDDHTVGTGDANAESFTNFLMGAQIPVDATLLLAEKLICVYHRLVSFHQRWRETHRQGTHSSHASGDEAVHREADANADTHKQLY